MPERIYLEVVLDAATVFGAQVRTARIERRWTVAELADRAGISRLTLLKVEHGDPTVSFGIALQVGALVGVPFFDADERSLASSACSAHAGLFGRRVRPAAEPAADLDF